MSANFEIKINAIRTGSVGELVDVVRKVEFTVKGTQEGQSFELPQTVDLSEPAVGTFITLSNLTEADVIGFVEAAFTNLDNVKAHIQFVLDKEVAKHALESKPLPWQPAAEADPTPTP